MCLAAVANEIRIKENTTVWKNVVVTEDKECTFIFGFNLSRNRVNVPKNPRLIFALSQQTYKSGFHCYTCREDAEKCLMFFEQTLPYIIPKDEVVTVGEQHIPLLENKTVPCYVTQKLINPRVKEPENGNTDENENT